MKRLYKSTRDCKVMGVCGGLGEYLGIDPYFPSPSVVCPHLARLGNTFPHLFGLGDYSAK